MSIDKEALTDRITNYLGNGGFWNPEHMEHEKVRDLLMECRSALASMKSEPASPSAAQMAPSAERLLLIEVHRIATADDLRPKAALGAIATRVQEHFSATHRAAQPPAQTAESPSAGVPTQALREGFEKWVRATEFAYDQKSRPLLWFAWRASRLDSAEPAQTAPSEQRRLFLLGGRLVWETDPEFNEYVTAKLEDVVDAFNALLPELQEDEDEE